MERAREEKERKEAAARDRASGPVLRCELRRMPAADQVRCRASTLGALGCCASTGHVCAIADAGS